MFQLSNHCQIILQEARWKQGQAYIPLILFFLTELVVKGEMFGISQDPRDWGIFYKIMFSSFVGGKNIVENFHYTLFKQ